MSARGPIVCTFLASLCAGAPAFGQGMPCGKAQDMERILSERYGEQRVSAGLADDGRLLQIYASPTSRSWTAVHTTAQGISCILAAGREWVDRKELSVAARGDRGLR